MSSSPASRITRDLTPEEALRLQRERELIAAEMPNLVAGDRLRREAGEEPTLSGDLRRAIHQHPLPLSELASRCGVSSLHLDEFLTGERTLRSDVLDRLATVLGLTLHAK